MSAALGIEIRQEIIERRQQGQSFRRIAAEMKQSYDTVRGIWQDWQAQGTLKPNYEACPHPGPRYDEALYVEAVEMKRAHPRWGAMVIRLKLQDQYDDAALPSVRTLQSWFRKAGVNRTPATQHKSQKVKRGQAVHEVWAVDAKERMKLADGSRASWLTVTDEASGAILEAEAFPPEALEPGGTHPGQSHPAKPVRDLGEATQDAF
jgi:transposase